ncbi:hypothetical protein vB_PsyM_KIL3b_0059 [Pseudomonas phage vB_PsyM_KIL3b]|uniref:HNH nuclease domain-containing protein n=3 Tax=Pseudomonas phage vB_PsyM_KIL1 TaxID=1777065 RepID=A0A142IFW9_9CAUD|nr:HNH endonuclease [Pseudomonas phage vB_PsyM_KIL1]AMR57306.1 hypothetical protein vB_PsyM_KIL1_0059 [Pseudomonas phage vB_PsyM_KIL1]AMR57626.1 hypothetical protein vB_PsyM_KIL3_0059 [Pseudomonas phage vB_PsyM_KIL3]AMR58124.1 hypothetical protein vB_PsyM_KIL3b_0059 [Pseudomonas phage vB_PsyM_KIL3b]
MINIGDTFGYLTVTSSIPRELQRYTKSGAKNGKRVFYECACRCGKALEVDICNLRLGGSCGCLRTENAQITKKAKYDLSGMSFGRLTVLKRVEPKSKMWLCRCSCKNHVEVQGARLSSGDVSSCGCLARETSKYNGEATGRKFRALANLPLDQKITTDNEEQRKLFKPLSKEVLLRDDFTCSWCSKIGGNLNVHHIELWSVKPDRRFDRTNLVTLCKPCHLTVHKNNFHGEPDPIMSILLEGYAKYMEELT